jgi:hypothetical protein
MGIGVLWSGEGRRDDAVDRGDGICVKSPGVGRAKFVEAWFAAVAVEDVVGGSSFMGMQ